MFYESIISPDNLTRVAGFANETFTEPNSAGYSTNQLDKFVSKLVLSSFHTVSYANFVFQIVFLIVGVTRLFEYRKSSVVKEGGEKVSATLVQWMVQGHWIVSSLWILEACFQSKIYPGCIFALVAGTVVWPVLRIVFEYENTHKFSTPSKLRESLSLKNFWVSFLILDFSRCFFLTYLWSEITSREKVIIGISLIRSFFLGGIIYLRTNGVYEVKENEEKKSEKAEDKFLDETISRYGRRWKLMKANINVNFKAKACIACCFAMIAVERALQFYSKVIDKNLMDSISAVATGTNSSSFPMSFQKGDFITSNVQEDEIVSRLGVEFRWDLLFIRTLIYVINVDILFNVREFLWNEVQMEVNQVAQVNLFRKMQDLSLRWHLEKRSGETLGVLRYGSDGLFWFFHNMFFYNLPDWLDVIIYLFYVAAIYPRLLNSVIFLTTIASLLIHFFGSNSNSEMRKAELKAEDKKMSEAIDSLVNYETVKYFNNEAHEATKFALAFKASQEKKWERRLAETWQRVGQSLIRQLGTFFGSLMCYWLIFNNEGLTVGDYHMFGSHLLKFYQPLMSLTHLHRSFKYAMDDIEKMTDVMEQETEIQDEPQAQKLKSPSGEITFTDVHFDYVPEREILHGISFTVPPGKTYAIVGPTGSGKSTVIRLIFRFYEIKSGSISIGGQDIREVQLESLRKAIAVIPQDTVLFHQSIKNNILYGNLSSLNPNEDVIAAAKCACIHERIESFPDKYDTVVGTRGLKLSGGERQRIAIARAVMKNPPILLMDEATSSLDSKTERQIQKTLETVCKNRTTLIIAHRLSTVINADKILVLDEGKIIESGSHNELLDLDGVYAKMFNTQSNENNNNNAENTD